MNVIDIHSENEAHFPFNQASGPRSPAIGPVVKRTQSKVKIAPTDVIAESTLRHFKMIGDGDYPWSPFYTEALDILSRPSLSWNSQVHAGEHPTAYQAAIQLIDEKDTVFISIQTKDGKRPGQIPEYAACLQSILAETKYATKTAPALPDTICALTGISATCYANGLAGARINITNVDRPGAFPGVDTDDAGKRFAISRQACDLLYIFKFHILPDLQGFVGGSKALVLPTFNSPQEFNHFHQAVLDYVAKVDKKEAASAEDKLSELYLDTEMPVAGLHFVWATFGQKMEDITFQLTDIFPSRLTRLQEDWQRFQIQESPFAPQYPVKNLQPDAWLNAPYNLYKRPGGKSAKTVNGDRLRDVVQFLMVHIYREREIQNPEYLITEGLDVARYYLRDMVASQGKIKSPFFGLLREGYNPKKQASHSTLTGFIKAHHHFIGFLNFIKIIKQDTIMDEIEFAPLRPFFGKHSGMKSPGQKGAFIIGVLFGHLVSIQERRKVNVGANAVPMIKNYELSSRDVPVLIKRIRAKITQYESDPNSRKQDDKNAEKKYFISGRMRGDTESLIKELGRLTLFESEPDISKEHLNYYLVLGQAFSNDIYYRKSKKEKTELPEGESQA